MQHLTKRTPAAKSTPPPSPTQVNLISNIQLNSIRRGLVQQNSTMLQYKDTLYKLWNMRWSGHKKSTFFSLFLDSVLPTSNEAWSNSSSIWILYVIHLMDDKYILRKSKKNLKRIKEKQQNKKNQQNQRCYLHLWWYFSHIGCICSTFLHCGFSFSQDIFIVH